MARLVADKGPGLFNSIRGDALVPLLLKIALSDSALPFKSVLHAIFALSCLHLHRNDEASAYRDSATSLVATSLAAGEEPKVAFANIAASMLLSTYEVHEFSGEIVEKSATDHFQIHETSNPSMNWVLYLCGTKSIILGALAKREIRDRECIVLRDWVYFHEVLGRFSVLHWARNAEDYPICYEGPVSRSIQISSDESPQVSL